MRPSFITAAPHSSRRGFIFVRDGGRAAVALLLSLLMAISTLRATEGLQQPAVAPAAQGPDLKEVIPFDRDVRTGTLPNGLRFFIRRNTQPLNRITMQMAVKAGSLDETDNQQGLAHFLEHMAFNGSASFKPGELMSYFESIGMRLGPHVNAYTSFEETLYRFEVPADRPDVVERGLTALADVASRLSLDPGQVEKERGVVIEEWRGRLGASSRISDKQHPVLFYESRYAERLPIGKPEIIKSAPVAELRAFYDTWYRPDLMAVVVVGDMDPGEMEAKIRSVFEPLQARGPAASRADRTVPLHPEMLVSVVADPEVTRSTAQVIWKEPRQSEQLVGDYRRALVEQLFARMFNERLDELSRKPDAQFLAASVGGGSLSQTVDAFSMSVRVQDGSIVGGLTALAIEAKRVREFGFHASELDRAKRSMMAAYERSYNERDRTESDSYAREYVSYYLNNEPSPGIEYEYQLAGRLMPGITLDEVTRLGQSILADRGGVVLAVSPEKPDLPVPTEPEMRAALSGAEKVAVTAWPESSTALALMETKPTTARVEERRELSDIGVTIVRFSNGLEAWLKPTDFKNDQVVFTMYALGGTSLAEPEDFLEASLAPSYVELSGWGGLKAVELERLLAGKRASASPFISLSTHGVSGSAAPTELETAMQLLHQAVTAPGDDPEAFSLLKRQLAASVANRGQSPAQVFGERVAQINTSNHYTSHPITDEDITSLDRSRMVAFFRDRFSNAADFTFFLVGTFEPNAVIPLLAQYVGSLPSTGKRASQFKDLEVRFPASIQREQVAKGREPRANTVVSFFADPPPDMVEAERIVAATTVLETLLRDLLREELGQTYSVSVRLAQSLPQRGSGHVQVAFGAAPENIRTMTDRLLKEIERLHKEEPTSDLTASAKESARRGYETALKQNGYWLGRMQAVHMLGQNPSDILTRLERIEALTPAAIRDTFRKYFPLDRYTVVTLVPEAPAQQP